MVNPQPPEWQGPLAPRCVLTIAGTDPSGAAGVQADLRVIEELGCQGFSAITALVWQSSQGVRGFWPTSPQQLRDQLDVIFEDLPIDAIKLGMLPEADSVKVVADALRERALGVPVICDPVLSSGDGAVALARRGVVEAMLEELMTQVTVLTPNLPEAWALARALGVSPASAHDPMAPAALAAALLAAGPQAILLKVGHWEAAQSRGEFSDLWADAWGVSALEALPGVPEDVRGTGCQLASALAAHMALGQPALKAAQAARRHLNALLHQSRLRLGRGRAQLVRAPLHPGLRHAEDP